MVLMNCGQHETAPKAGRSADLRLYGIGAQILRDLGVGRMRLMAAPRKMPSMAGFDLEVSGFRRDLLSRLGDWTIHLSTLAERRADIIVLWEHFLRLESPPGQSRTWTAEWSSASSPTTTSS